MGDGHALYSSKYLDSIFLGFCETVNLSHWGMNEKNHQSRLLH